MDISLSRKRRLGYASGIITESLLYNLFLTYYLVFLTDVVHILPALAGTIMLVGTVWDAISDPLVGYHADRPGSDKRRFMMRALLPMAVAAIGCFLAWPDFPVWGQMVYYIAVTVIFWLCYTYYTIPYYAVLPEITQDYDQRTKIRGQSSLINVAAIFVGTAVPSFLPAVIQETMGFSERFSWLLMVALFALIAVVFGWIAYRSLRDIPLKRPSSDTLRRIWPVFFQIMRLKPVKWLSLFVAAYLLASSMIQANIIYTIKHCLGLDEDTMTLVVLVLIGCMVIFIPLVTKLAERTDRRRALIVFFSGMLAVLLAVKIIGLNSLWVLIVEAVAMSMGTAAFWTVFYAMAYDIDEIDEFVNGTRREGVVTALPQLIQKLGSALGVWLAGVTLTITGYDSAAPAQSPEAVTGIENIATVFPAIFLTVSLVGLILYPVTKARFSKLHIALENKRAGKPCDVEGLEKLIR